jgi:hypothetical protein
MNVTTKMKMQYLMEVEGMKVVRRVQRKYLNRGRKLKTTNHDSSSAYDNFFSMERERQRQKQVLRALHLARMFIKGRFYSEVEQNSRKPVDLSAVLGWLDKFDIRVTFNEVKEWLE